MSSRRDLHLGKVLSRSNQDVPHLRLLTETSCSGRSQTKGTSDPKYHFSRKGQRVRGWQKWPGTRDSCSDIRSRSVHSQLVASTQKTRAAKSGLLIHPSAAALSPQVHESH